MCQDLELTTQKIGNSTQKIENSSNCAVMFAVPVFGSPWRLLTADIRYRLLLCRESLGSRMEEGCLCCGAAVYMDYLQLDLMIFVVFSSLSHSMILYFLYAAHCESDAVCYMRGTEMLYY